MLSQIFFAETKRALSFDQKIGKAKVQLLSGALVLQHPTASQTFLLFSLFKWTPTSVVH